VSTHHGGAVTSSNYKIIEIGGHYVAGETAHETDEEWAYNFRKGPWECVRDFTREYDLVTDQETLVGDNSGWDGAGRPWKEWFRQRHFERLRLRYRHDTIPDKLGAGSQQAAVA